MQRFLVASVLVAFAHIAAADTEYAESWGPAVGTPVPMLSAEDQYGKRQTLETLAGANGLLFVFNRSVDW